MNNKRNRFILVLLCASLLAGSMHCLPAAAEAVSPTLIGDVNADDSVNAKDAAEVLIASARSGAAGELSLTALQQWAADVNGDGKINASDAADILAYAAYYGVGGKKSAAQFFEEAASAPRQILSYAEQRVPELKGVSNARQLGGYINRGGKTFRRNVLIRSGSLAHATDTAKTALVEQYHVSDIMDFRYDRELNPKTQDPEIEGITYHNVAMSPTGHIGAYFADHPEDFAKLQELQQQAGKTGDDTELSIFQAEIGMVTPEAFIRYFESAEAALAYREAFQILLNKPEDAAILFHCSAGKDRTGMVAMLLLAALDFDRDVIMQDYLMTNEANAEKIEKLSDALAGYTDDKQLTYDAMYSQCVYPEVMEQIVDDLATEYGSLKGYLRRAVGLTDADFAKLEELYLEP